MLFDTFAEGFNFLLLATFILAVVMGAVANKTNFCTMGAVSDAVNMGDYNRMRAWLLAIAVAMLGVTLLEYQGLVSPDEAFPPYRQSNLIWIENLVGGFLFGIGMTLASGCGNKTLIRIGGGNIKSIVVLAIIAVIAYYMTNVFHSDTDQTLMSFLFGYETESGATALWIREAAISLTGPQDLGAIVGGEDSTALRFVFGLILGMVLLAMVFKSSDFRSSHANIVGGLVVGLAVLGGWYLSSNIQIAVEDEDPYTMGKYYGEWDMLVDTDTLDLSEEQEDDDAAIKAAVGIPSSATTLSPQSYTFINPMGQFFGYALNGMEKAYLSFGLVALFGIIVGSFLWAILSKGFRIEWFASGRDVMNHVVGAVLMGFGGVLAMGCTIGQGITGVSTLAVGSVIALLAIIFGSALTMKIQYYKLVYEEEAGFFKALLTALVDMKMLPEALRKLEKV